MPVSLSSAKRGLLLGLVATATVALPMPGGPAFAGCAAPTLSLAGEVDGAGSTPVVTADGPIEVEGRGFVDGCDDEGGGSSWGCDSPEGEVETPLSDVELVVRQGGRIWELGSVDAGTAEDGEKGQVTWRVTLPSALEPGRAVLVAGELARMRVEVVASSR